MKVKDLIANLRREDKEAEVYIQDRDYLLDVYEVTSGKNLDKSNFVVIVPEQDED